MSFSIENILSNSKSNSNGLCKVNNSEEALLPVYKCNLNPDLELFQRNQNSQLLSSVLSNYYNNPLLTDYTYFAPHFYLHPTTPPISIIPNSIYIPQQFSKRKGGQIRFSSAQTAELEQKFKNHKYLTPEDRRLLAQELRLTDRQVKTWFQNRRAKWRRCKNMTQYYKTTENCDIDGTVESTSVEDESSSDIDVELRE